MVRDGYFTRWLFVAAPFLWAGLPAGRGRPAAAACGFFSLVLSRSGADHSGSGWRGGISRGWQGDGCFNILTSSGENKIRISIFLSVFDVHVNRSPIAGIVREVRYQRGKFLNAMNRASAESNEQNIVSVEGDGETSYSSRSLDCWREESFSLRKWAIAWSAASASA
jgi:phosphatidylserine decarboxylase